VALACAAAVRRRCSRSGEGRLALGRVEEAGNEGHLALVRMEEAQTLVDGAKQIMLQTLRHAGVAPPPPEEYLPQVLRATGNLDGEVAAALWCQHLKATSQHNISAISDEQVREAYSMGFCALSGEDVDGLPMIWVRLALSEVSKLTPSLAVLNTWLAQDATLRDDANKRGLCFVYDLSGVGLKNVTFNPMFLSAAITGATSHPSRFSRVWLLDAPHIFLAAWSVGSRFLPPQVREAVRFHSTGDRSNADCFAPICYPSELPVYLGGDTGRFGGSYAEWMFDRLKGRSLVYRQAMTASAA